MIRLAVKRVRPDQVSVLRDWLSDLNGPRSIEARATLVDEGCTHEMAILVDTSDGPLLVYAMEVADEARSVQAANESVHAVDAEHRAIMKAVLQGEPNLERLLDLRPTAE